MVFKTQESIEADIDAAICAVKDMHEELGLTPEVKELTKEVLTLKFSNNG